MNLIYLLNLKLFSHQNMPYILHYKTLEGKNNMWKI